MRGAASQTGVTNLRTIMGFGSCFNKKSSSCPWTYASFPATVASPMLSPGTTMVPVATQPYSYSYSYSHPPQLLAPLSPAIVPMAAPVHNVHTVQAFPITGQPLAMMQSPITYIPVPFPVPVPVPSPSPPPPPPPHVPSPVVRSPLPAQRNPSPSRSYQPRQLIMTSGNDHWSYPQPAPANNGPGGGSLLSETLQPQQGAAQQASPYNLTLNLHVTTPYHHPTQLDDATPTPTRSVRPLRSLFSRINNIIRSPAPVLVNGVMPGNIIVSPPTPPPHPSNSPRVPIVTGTYQPCANAPQVLASVTFSPSPRWTQQFEDQGQWPTR